MYINEINSYLLQFFEIYYILFAWEVGAFLEFIYSNHSTQKFNPKETEKCQQNQQKILKSNQKNITKIEKVVNVLTKWTMGFEYWYFATTVQ